MTMVMVRVVMVAGGEEDWMDWDFRDCSGFGTIVARMLEQPRNLEAVVVQHCMVNLGEQDGWTLVHMFHKRSDGDFGWGNCVAMGIEERGGVMEVIMILGSRVRVGFYIVLSYVYAYICMCQVWVGLGKTKLF